MTQTEGLTKDARTPISGKALRQALRETQHRAPLSGKVIDGEELVRILAMADFPIRIADSLITGGLDLSDLPAVPVAVAITGSQIDPSAITRRLSAGFALYARGVTFSKEVDFQGTRFQGPLNLRRTTFQGPAQFRQATLADNAQFDGARFGKRASFHGATAILTVSFRNVTFEDDASFGNTTVGSVGFEDALFKGGASFRGATFRGKASFLRTRFERLVSFKSAEFHAERQNVLATFGGPVNFEETVFRGRAVFSPQSRKQTTQIFLDTVRFHNVAFAGDAEFDDLTLPEGFIFDRNEVGGTLSANNSVFEGAANFFGTEIGGEARFKKAIFKGPTSFQKVRIGGHAEFTGASFESGARFLGAHFLGETSFRAARFADSATFQAVCASQRMEFQNADLGQYADFRDASIAHLDLRSRREPTILRSRFDLRGARIRLAQFEDVIFESALDLSDAIFGQASDRCLDGVAAGPQRAGFSLRFTTFEDSVSALRTSFTGHIDLVGTKFEQGLNLTDARFPTLEPGEDASFSLAFVDLGDLRLSWNQLPHPDRWLATPNVDPPEQGEPPGPSLNGEPVSRTLAYLEGLFRARKQLTDANAAYYHRKSAELRETREAGWISGRVEKELEWLLWGVTCGYGTKIWWIVGWAVLLNLFFTLVYWRWAVIERKPHPDVEQDFSFRLRLLDLPQHYREKVSDPGQASPSSRKLINALRVSSVILFKVGYRDTILSGSIGRIGIKTVVRVEWFLGFLVLAAFTVTLSNTQPLINRLISGVL